MQTFLVWYLFGTQVCGMLWDWLAKKKEFWDYIKGLDFITWLLGSVWHASISWFLWWSNRRIRSECYYICSFIIKCRNILPLLTPSVSQASGGNWTQLGLSIYEDNFEIDPKPSAISIVPWEKLIADPLSWNTSTWCSQSTPHFSWLLYQWQGPEEEGTHSCSSSLAGFHSMNLLQFLFLMFQELASAPEEPEVCSLIFLQTF